MLNFQKYRIQILRAVGEEIERRHQQHQIAAQLPVALQYRQQSGAFFAFARRQPHRRLLHAIINKRQQQDRRCADNEHAAPADRFEQQAVHHRRQQITERIASLENTRHQAA